MSWQKIVLAKASHPHAGVLPYKCPIFMPMSKISLTFGILTAKAFFDNFFLYFAQKTRKTGS